MSRASNRIEVVITRENDGLVARPVDQPTGSRFYFRGLEFPDLVREFGVSPREGRALITATNKEGGRYITTIQ